MSELVIMPKKDYKDICDAVRAKTGGTELLKSGDIPAQIKSIQTGGGSGEEWFNDGNTYIWITLQEGRTSPMLGVGVKGTVTVDWGDGTEPDVLTGTSTSTAVWTPNHEYAKAGDYVISLSVDGEMAFLGASGPGSCILRYNTSNDNRNRTYQNAITKVELGNGNVSIGSYAFCYCYSLASVAIPDGVTSIGSDAFHYCGSLASVAIPDGVTSISDSTFWNCYSLASVAIPDGVTSIGSNAFNNCQALASVAIPDGVTSIGNKAFYSCYSLASVAIPDGVTSINTQVFYACYGVRYYDFSNHTSVPALANTNAFQNIPADCQMLIPSALYDEWKAATNWATYASKMVAV